MSLNPIRCIHRYLRKWRYPWFRSSHKFKTQKPRPRVMERRVFEEITKPIIPNNTNYLRDSCLDPNARQNQPEEPNPYEEFLLKRWKMELNASKMIIICHCNPLSGVRFAYIQMCFKLIGMKYAMCSNKHLKLLTENTHLANMTPLLTSQNHIITCPEVKIAELLSLLKTLPEIFHLGGFVLDRLVTRQHLQELAKLPPIEQLLGEFVACLNLVGGARTSSMLSSNQQRLSLNLEQYQKQTNKVC